MAGNTMRVITGNYLVLTCLALFKLLLHLVVNALGGYGYFRDEFYYIACSNHLDWGYVDQPPLSIALLAVSRLLIGDSLFALRLVPAIAGAVTVFLTGLLALELGGGKRAQVFASLAAIVSPIVLGMSGYYSMNAIELAVWAAAAILIVRVVKHQRPRDWIVLGMVLGLG